ncbi:MAG: hypothetical protein ABSG76_21235, partial [Xanthobacteraceae bacterium]
IEATVTTLTIDRCVLGGVRTRNGGLVETVTITNSILQAIPTRGDGLMVSADIKDPERLETRLVQAAAAQSTDLVANRLLALEPGILAAIGAPGSPPHLASPPSPAVPARLLDLMNLIVRAPTLYEQKTFANVPLSAATRQMLGVGSPPSRSPALNRALLDDAFPLELADAALAFGDGVVNLSRCTVLGRIVAHQLEASESILWDLSQIDDAQTGCVRFSAWADGSVLPRKFESVRVHQQAPLFTATDFGQPGYGQLGPLVDDVIMPDVTASATPSNTISTGAVDGSEMGAFARDKNPIKERGLLLKYQEYMPAGLVPVIVHVT